MLQYWAILLLDPDDPKDVTDAGVVSTRDDEPKRRRNQKVVGPFDQKRKAWAYVDKLDAAYA